MYTPFILIPLLICSMTSVIDNPGGITFYRILQGVSKKTLFSVSCSSGGSGLLQRAGYQSRTLSIILFLVDCTTFNPNCPF